MDMAMVVILLIIVFIGACAVGSIKLHKHCIAAYSATPFRIGSLLAMASSLLFLFFCAVMDNGSGSSVIVGLLLILGIYAFNLYKNLKLMPVGIAIAGTTLAYIDCFIVVVAILWIKDRKRR